MAVMPSPGVRVTVAESRICDLGRVSEWCDLWEMKLNTMRVSRSCTINASLVAPINYWRNWAEGVWWPRYIGSHIDSKMTFEKHLRLVSWATFQRLGILRKSWLVFHDKSLLVRCFRGFVLPVLGYCSAVWCTAADTHLKPLDRVASGARFLTWGVFECDIAHRRTVALLCMLYKIRCYPMHPLSGALPVPYVPMLVTSGALARPSVVKQQKALALVAHRYTYAPPRCRTSQSHRTLFLSQCPCGTIYLTLR